MKTVVLGLGNTLLGDDGVGIYALNELQSSWQDKENQDTVEFVDGGTLSFTPTEKVKKAIPIMCQEAQTLLEAWH